jgi:hypothetical protein
MSAEITTKPDPNLVLAKLESAIIKISAFLERFVII